MAGGKITTESSLPLNTVSSEKYLQSKYTGTSLRMCIQKNSEKKQTRSRQQKETFCRRLNKWLANLL
jgi:hypothetical protein